VTIGQVLPGVDTSCRILATCILCAGIGAAMGWRFGWSAPLPALLYLGAIGAAIGATDLVLWQVPDRVVLPAYVVGPTLLALASATSDRWPALVRAGTAMLVSAAFLVALALAAPGGIGLGDPQMGGRRRSAPRLARMGRPLDPHAPRVRGRGSLRDRAARRQLT
jgi:hypothetical protein